MLTLFFTFLSLTLSAHAQLLPPPTAGEFEIKGEFNYYSSAKNYAPDGGSVDLLNGGKLTQMLGLGEFIFDWTQEWRLYAGASAGQTTTDNYSLFSLTNNTKTNSGLSEGWFGAQYWYELESFDLVPEVDIIYPGSRVDTNSDDPLLSEGALRLKGGAWAVYQWDDFRPFGFLGYESRDGGRSSLLDYKVGLQYAQSSAWWLQGELRGYSSVTNDGDTDGVARDVYLLRVQGGSYHDYSRTPSLHEAALLGGFHIGQLGFYAGGAMSYAGRSSADGLTGLVGVTFDGALFVNEEAPGGPQATQYRPPPEQRFQVKPEKYDNGLFKDNPVPDDSAPAIVVRRQVVHKRPVSVRPKPVLPKKDSLNVELLMKQTEKSLEKGD